MVPDLKTLIGAYKRAPLTSVPVREQRRPLRSIPALAIPALALGLALLLGAGAAQAQSAATFVSARTNESGTGVLVKFSKTMTPPNASAGDARQYKVTVGNAERTPSLALLTDGEVGLLISPGIKPGQTVMVRYEKPTDDRTKATDSDGLEIDSFSNKPVANVARGIETASVNGRTLTLGLYAGVMLDTSSTPAANRFRYTRGGSAVEHSPASVAVTASAATLTLRHAVAPGETVTVRYSAPASGGLRAVGGGALPDFAFDTVTNDTPDTTAPQVVEAFAAQRPDGIMFVAVRFDEEVPQLGQEGDWTVRVAGSVRPLGMEEDAPWVGRAGLDTALLILRSPAAHGQRVTVSYSGTGAKDGAENSLRQFTDFPVENRVPGPARIASVALTSTPSFDADGNNVPDTYGRRELIEVTVTWDREVTWSYPESGSRLRVRVNMGSGFKAANLVTGGAATGTARALRFRYQVAQSDTDTDGTHPQLAGSNLVIKAQGATLVTAGGGDAQVDRAGLPVFSADEFHKVNGGRNDAAAPRYSSGAVSGATLTLTYNERLDEYSVPAAGDFTVMVAGAERSVSEVEISGTKVILTLASAVVLDQTVTVAYAKPAANPVQDLAGNDAATLSARTVAESAAPTVVSAETSDNGQRIGIRFSEPMQFLALGQAPLTAFKVRVGSETSDRGLTGNQADRAGVAGSVVFFSLQGDPVTPGQSVRVQYTQPAGNPRLQDNAGNLPGNFTRTAVNTVPTTLTAATMAADGRSIALTWEHALARGSGLIYAFILRGTDVGVTGDQHPERVDVAGKTATLHLSTPVTAGQKILVSYRPNHAEVPLRVAGGGVVEEFLDRAVINAVGGADAPAPAGSAFEVSATSPDGGIRIIGGTGTASILGREVEVELVRAVGDSELAFASYAKPAANPLQDTDGNAAAGLAGELAEVIDERPPALVSGSVSGRIVTLYYSKTLDGPPAPPASAFSVTAAANARVVQVVQVKGSAVVLRLDAAAAATDAVTLSYTAGAYPIRDAAGNAAANVSSRTLTNLGPDAPDDPPALVTKDSTAEPPVDPAVADWAQIVLTFTQPLDPASVPGAGAFSVLLRGFASPHDIAIEGAQAVLKLIGPAQPCDSGIAVTYTPPLTNPLRNGFGAPVAAFAGRAVTNARSDACVDGKWNHRVKLERFTMEMGVGGEGVGGSSEGGNAGRQMRRRAAPGAGSRASGSSFTRRGIGASLGAGSQASGSHFTLRATRPGGATARATSSRTSPTRR